MTLGGQSAQSLAPTMAARSSSRTGHHPCCKREAVFVGGVRDWHTPGHRKSSIATLTADGDLLAGDTLMNAKRRFIL